GPGSVFEFYLVPGFRQHAMAGVRGVIEASKANALECQTNDVFYTSLVRQMSRDLTSDTILFAAGQSNDLSLSDGVFRPRRRSDRVFEHHAEPVGDFVIDVGGDVVGTGGFPLPFNTPLAPPLLGVRSQSRAR